MIKNLFPHYAAAISKANTPEKQQCCGFLIDHLENDYLLMRTIPGKDERIQELRNQLEEKRQELLREQQGVITSQCGVII